MSLLRKNQIVIAILTIQVAILLLLGRITWCKCGTLALWVSDSFSSHTSQHILDPYSFSHFQHGVLLYLLFFACNLPLRFRFWGAALIEGAWEILENTSLIIERYRSVTMSLDYYGDSIMNSVGDSFCCLLGVYVAAKLPWKWSLLIYLVIEVAMVVTIRDSLFLNALMLIYPLDAVKQWQLHTNVMP